MIEWKSRTFLLSIISLQLIVDVFIFLDVPIARQIAGFVSLTFIPGSIILKLLRFDGLDMVETVLFSIGFSIAYLMLGGFLINEFGSTVNISQPLSLTPLLVFLNVSIFLSTFWLYFRGEYSIKPFKLSLSMLLSFTLPILSIIGAMCVNIFGNNLILLMVFILVTLLFVMIVFFNKLESKFPFAFAIFIIAISILYHSSLISNYIVSFGSDVPVEHFVFKTTQYNSHWSSTVPSNWDIGYGRVNAMLSVTILPTIYSILLKMDTTWVFKLVFPLLFAFVPLGLYQILKSYISKKYAFISTFLFMAQSTFYTEMLGLNRQMIAELFFILLLFVVLKNRMEPFSRIICFIIFGFGLITSHYGLSEIFLFFIFLTFILLFVIKKPHRKITANMILLFSAIMFTWYLYTSRSAAFNSILEFGNYVYGQLGEFFNPASRGQMVLTGLGLESPPTIWNAISRGFAYAIEFLIVIGFIGLIIKRVRVHFETIYLVCIYLAMVFLIMLILLPGLANTMNMSRFYHVLLFFLAPLCVVGAIFLGNLLFKRRKELIVSVLLTVVLVPYFLFQTGFMYEITGSESWSVPLSKHRMSALQLYGYLGYNDAFSVFGAQWLSRKVSLENAYFYADSISQVNVLTIYGSIYRGYIDNISNTTKVTGKGILYLNSLNVIYGMFEYGDHLWNSSDLSYIFDDLSLIYSNGGCQVYRKTE